MEANEYQAEENDRNDNQFNGSVYQKPKKRIPIGLKIVTGVLIGTFAFFMFSVLPPGGLSQKAAVFSEMENIQVVADQSAASVQPEGAVINTQDPYTFIWMSDTQGYAEYYPEIYTSMTQWVAEKRRELNIQYLIHTGDFVNDNDAPEQWENANKAIGLLNGNIPYLTVAGNHDIFDGAENYNIYNNYFDLVDAGNFEVLPTFGGLYKNGQGRYDMITVNNDSYIILSMGYGIDSDAIDWMNKILKQYASRTAILCVHGYMEASGELTSDGKKLYPEVVVPNANVKLVLCGHRHGVNHFTVKLDDNGDGKTDRTVYELLSNYQDETDAGSGYLSILTFDDQMREIKITSYSPYLKDYIYFEDTPDLEEFIIPMDF